MHIEVIAGGKRHCLQAQAGAMLSGCLLDAGLMEGTECGGRHAREPQKNSEAHR